MCNHAVMPFCSHSAFRWLRAGLFLALCPFLPAAPMKFDLPAQAAGVALLAYSTQAGAGVLFASGQVAGIRTNAVIGLHEPAEAMMRLLADTGLAAARSASGKWIITASGPGTSAASPPPASATPADSRVASISDQKNQSNPAPMKTAKSTGLFAVIAGLFATAVAADAQPIASSPKEDPVMLTPFEVSTDRDVGFIGSSALSGSRMATDLKDTPVPYTVLTQEFLSALNLTNPDDALAWMPNTYVEMDQGNGAIFGAGVGKGLNNSGYTSRGINSGGSMRNFYKFDYSTDNYNTERIDVARGGNSILFGLSTYAGAVSSGTKEAKLNSTRGEAYVSGGSWDNYRATFDYNVPLGRRLAVRFMALWMDGVPAQNGFVDGVFERRNGLSAATTWKPFEKTKIKLNFEKFHREQTATVVSYFENFSGWEGTTVYASPTNARTTGVSATTAAIYWTPNVDLGSGQPSAVWSNYFNNATRASYYSSNMPILDLKTGVVPASRFDVVNANSAFRTSMFKRSTNFAPSGVPMANLNLNTLEGSLSQQISRDLYLDVGGMYNRRLWRADVAPNRGLGNIFLDLDQYLVAPGSTLKTFSPASPATLVNTTTPANSVANPNYLKPYTQIYTRPNYNWEDTTQGRFSLGYIKNNTRFGSFQLSAMGGYYYRHTDGYFENLVAKLTTPFSYQNANANDPRNLANGDSGAVQARLFTRYYLDQPGRPQVPTSGTFKILDAGTNTVNSVEVGLLPAPQSFSVQNIESSYYQMGGSAKFLKEKLVFVGALRWDRFFSTQKSALVNGMDYPANWDGHTAFYRPRAPQNYTTMQYALRNADGTLVRNAAGQVSLLPANARPRNTASNLNGVPLPQYLLQSQGGLVSANDPYAGNTKFQDDYSPPDVRENHPTRTLGGVYHVTSRLSAFANYSDTYQQPGGVVVSPDGASLPTSHSLGYDYGFRYSFWNDSFFIGLTRFDGLIENETSATKDYSAINNDYSSMFNALYNTNKWNDFTSTGVNQQMFPSVPTGYQDLREKRSKGYELELQGNLLEKRNLNVMASAGYTDAFGINPLPYTLAFYKNWEPTLIKVLNDTAVAVNPTTRSASFDPTLIDQKFWPSQHPTAGRAYNFQGAEITAPTGSVYTSTPVTVYDPVSGLPVLNAAGQVLTAIKRQPVISDFTDAQNAINNWTNLQNSLKNLASLTTPQKVRALRQVSAKIYARYRFVEGSLKGFSVGLGANYSGRQIIGNRAADTITVNDPVTKAASAADDPNVGPTDYLYQPAFTLYNLTLAYTRKLGSRYTMTVNLAVNNLFDYDRAINTGIGQVPAENPSLPSRTTVPLAYYYTTPRSFVFSTSLQF